MTININKDQKLSTLSNDLKSSVSVPSSEFGDVDMVVKVSGLMNAKIGNTTKKEFCLKDIAGEYLANTKMTMSNGTVVENAQTVDMSDSGSPILEYTCKPTDLTILMKIREKSYELSFKRDL